MKNQEWLEQVDARNVKIMMFDKVSFQFFILLHCNIKPGELLLLPAGWLWFSSLFSMEEKGISDTTAS